jgi:O-antigen ligase
MFIPALVLLFARLHANPRRASDVSLTILLLGAVFLSHTRGIWLGVIAGCGTGLLLRLVLDWPRARAVLPFATVGLVLVLVALSVPTTVRPIAEAVTGGSAEQSSSVRLEQTPELLDGFGEHPVLGSGLGAVLPSGYRRSEVTPWSFELAYLQLMFQAGIVGIALLAWLPTLVLRDTVRRLLVGVPDNIAIALVAGIGALIGLLVSYASNPYLITSAGTLALAVSVAGCGAGWPPRPGRRGQQSRYGGQPKATELPHAGGW